MQQWDPKSPDVSKITPDKEKAKSLLQMVLLREKDIETKNIEFTTLIVEGYYEIVKELITAIMSLDGYKTLSHEMLIGYLAEYYKEFSSAEITTIDQLRIARNDIAYRGIMIKPGYLARNKDAILNIISKLKEIAARRIGRL